ncbi:hypothetical protein CLIB1444_02S04236 [[Candida] jaroonii]|uniref:Uncharacterized protein n=1 Tax=[Candida] jaroonii TaxID=467808 RepID=A0ACA9Y3L9_9ASCO|nr:hypothetical protein CLIB1444_02S04236 [[Candida] jaroonii]
MIHPKFRRKSSNFRPNLYYDSALIQSKTEFELLPVITLIKIFSYLNTTDLLSICLTSRLFYLPAIINLYEKIIIINDDETLIKFVKNMVDYADLGTIVNFKNIDKLLGVIEHTDKVGRHIKRLIILNDKIDFDNDSNYLKLQTLISKIHLIQLINPSLNINRLESLNLSTLKYLSITIKQDNHKAFDIKLPNLKALKVYYENKEFNKVKFQILAKNLVKNKIIDNLNKLEFEELIVKDLKLMNESNNNLQLAIWIDFFIELNILKFQKYTSLTTLSIDGFINNQGYQICQLMNLIFDLKNLQVLKYNIKEFSHLNEVHYENDHNLLINLLTSSNLKCLMINPTFDCLTCQLNMILKMLKMVQLDTLDLKFEFLNLDNVKQLITSINNQSNLKQLKLYDKSNEFANEHEFKKLIGDRFNDFERINFNLQLLQKYDAIDYQFDRISMFAFNEFYKSNSDNIAEYLNNYLKVIGLDIKQFKQLNKLNVNNIGLMNNNGYRLMNIEQTPVIIE